MSTYIRLLKSFAIFILIIYSTIDLTFAQTEKSLSKSKFLGTWHGSIIKNYDGTGTKKVISLNWRIHSINNSKQQVEITKIRDFFADSTIKALEPIKSTYKGFEDKGGIVLEMEDKSSNNLFTINLTPNDDNESIGLRGQVERSLNNKDSYAFFFVKVDEDTTNYVKPKNQKADVKLTQFPHTIQDMPLPPK